MNNKKLVFYTLYKEDEKSDLKIVSQYNSIEDIQKALNVPKKTILNRISDKKKILNNYIIYKDYISANEI